MSEPEVPNIDANVSMLINPEFGHEITADWFVPEFWGDKAAPVSSGGRGGAWFIRAGDDQFVLRAYLRGGLVARIFRRTYMYTGERNVRSFSEFRILSQLQTIGLPVPAPVAAWYKKLSPIQYQAAIIIERIEGAEPLGDIIGSLEPADWRRLGQTIRRFHDAEVRHADLNCFNVLVVGHHFFLIDFDKSNIMPAGASQKWKVDNLNRFARSLRKVSGDDVVSLVWESFMDGYEGNK